MGRNKTVNLEGKCGSCVYASVMAKSGFIVCHNEDFVKHKQAPFSDIRPRIHKACKRYEKKEGDFTCLRSMIYGITLKHKDK